MKKSALLYAVLVIALLGLVSCNAGAHITKPPSGLTERVLASQSASSPSASPGLIIVNGFNDTIGRGGISAGSSPTFMETSPERATLLAFDSAAYFVKSGQSHVVWISVIPWQRKAVNGQPVLCQLVKARVARVGQETSTPGGLLAAVVRRLQ